MYYEKGFYRFKVTNQGFGESKNKNPQFFLEGEPQSQVVRDEEGNEQDYPCERQYQRTVTWTITDKTIDRVMSDLQKLGFAGTKFSQLSLDSANCHSFVGQEIIVECRHEPYTDGSGKMGERWELPYEGKPSEPKQSLSSVAKKLDNLFGKKLSDKSAGARKAPATAPAQRPAAKSPPVTVPDDFGGEEEDTIPF